MTRVAKQLIAMLASSSASYPCLTFCDTCKIQNSSWGTTDLVQPVRRL